MLELCSECNLIHPVSVDGREWDHTKPQAAPTSLVFSALAGMDAAVAKLRERESELAAAVERCIAAREEAAMWIQLVEDSARAAGRMLTPAPSKRQWWERIVRWSEPPS
jgi:hypothetical protein